MDALRRAEVSGAEPPANDEPLMVTPAQTESAESQGALQLEPMDKTLPETPADAANSNDAKPAMPAAAGQTPNDAEASRQPARVALSASTPRRSPVRKRLVFISSALASAAIILVAYYFWESHDRISPQVPPAATLIDMAAPLPAADDTIVPASAVTVTHEQPAKTATATTAIGAETEPDAAPAPAQTDQAAGPTPVPAAKPYRIEIRKSRGPDKVPAALKQAYQDYQHQSYAEAEQGYRQVLRRYPDNRDAMLGLAAIAQHQGNRQVARYYYQRLLQLDPADKTAGLALQALAAGQYSLADGSRMKHWLQSDPHNPRLHFALGNQYAANGQWKEAQQAYFEACRMAPDNADYAFNLAVSLDRLQLPRQALDYYRRARDLADRGGALFSRQQLERRIAQLQAVTERTP